MKKLIHLFKRSIIYLLMTTYFISYIAIIGLLATTCIIFVDLIAIHPDSWFVIRMISWLCVALLLNMMLKYFFKDDNDLKLLARLKYGYNVNIDNLDKNGRPIENLDIAKLKKSMDGWCAPIATDRVPTIKRKPGRPKKQK